MEKGDRLDTGSDRRTEVPDGCGGLPHTRTFGTFVKFFSLNSEGGRSPEVPDNSGFSNRNLRPLVYLCDAALNCGIMAMNPRNYD
jgi:hypothetical protein